MPRQKTFKVGDSVQLKDDAAVTGVIVMLPGDYDYDQYEFLDSDEGMLVGIGKVAVSWVYKDEWKHADGSSI